MSFYSVCYWIHNVWSNRKQYVRVVDHISNFQHWCSTGLCVLSALYTSDCTSNCDSVKLTKFADDTTLVSLISNNDKSTYWKE